MRLVGISDGGTPVSDQTFVGLARGTVLEIGTGEGAQRCARREGAELRGLYSLNLGN